MGVEGVARKVTKRYWGVDGVVRAIRKSYLGVDGVARQYFVSIWNLFVGWVSFKEGASITVYNQSAEWEDSSLALRVEAKAANNNDEAAAYARATLTDDFSEGGTLSITWRSSNDPNHVEKKIGFSSDGKSFHETVLKENISEGESISEVYDIPAGTVAIRFNLYHHAPTQSAEYWLIDNLVINGKTYIPKEEDV